MHSYIKNKADFCESLWVANKRAQFITDGKIGGPQDSSQCIHLPRGDCSHFRGFNHHLY